MSVTSIATIVQIAQILSVVIRGVAMNVYVRKDTTLQDLKMSVNVNNQLLYLFIVSVLLYIILVYIPHDYYICDITAVNSYTIDCRLCV